MIIRQEIHFIIKKKIIVLNHCNLNDLKLNINISIYFYSNASHLDLN